MSYLKLTAIEFNLKSFIIGLMVGSFIVGCSIYYHLESHYVQVHDSNIGGFVFKDGKAYQLSELKSL
jgi:hypothetical protein